MSRVRRIYAEKRPGYDVAARQLCQELREALGTDAIARVRLFQRYDVEGLSDAAFESARGIIFSEPNADVLYDENLPQMDAHLLAVEYLPGQYDQRADSAAQCLQLLSPDQARPKVVCAKVYAIEGEGVTREMMDAIAHHVINPVEARRASMEKPETLEMQADAPADVAIVEGFTRMDDKVLSDMVARMGMAMSAEDLCFCRDYFRDTEKRDPSVTELRAIDTYWSDHCRHTTFLTAIDDIAFDDGRFAAPVKAAYELYIDTRRDVYGARQKDISLMDMATLGAKALRKLGKLDDLDASDEINACSIVVTANVDGRDEPWLIMFKNETHNHPTEIEAIRRCGNLSGRRDPRSAFWPQLCLSGHAHYGFGRPAHAVQPHPCRVSCPSAALPRPLRRVIPATATRLAWRRARCRNIIIRALSPSAWSWARSSPRHRAIMCAALSLNRAIS